MKKKNHSIKNKSKNQFKSKAFKKMILAVLILLLIIIIFAYFRNSHLKNNEEFITDFSELELYLQENPSFEIAVISGGCFWCVESDLEKLHGVQKAISGYTSNNSQDNIPTYQEVASGQTDFRESVLVVYDSNKISYENVVKYFFITHDASDSGGSFYDRGFQYTSAIYYQDKEQKEIIEKIIKEINEKKLFNSPIITSVEELKNFYVAEEYHQNYYKKNPNKYQLYRIGSGREKFVNDLQEKYQDLN